MSKGMNKSMKRSNMISQTLLHIGLAVLAIAVLIPFVILVSVSLSSETDISYYGYSVIPRNVDLTAYKYVFRYPDMILDAYKVTAIFSLLGTVGNILMTSLFAYPLSRKNFKIRQKLSFFMYFTTMFSGGLVPTYILITQYLHLNDTIWVYIIPGLFGVWTAFVMRTFFNGIPDALVESAYIDGASEYRILFQIMYPLSTPMLATMACTGFLGRWNDWNTSMLYIDNDKLYSLQYMLQRILQNLTILENNPDAAQFADDMKIPSETVRMAMAVVVAGPIVAIFPFFQKYFAKGMVMGSVKG